MCKYCSKSELEKMRNDVDAILSEDYSDDTEDRLINTLKSYAVFTIRGWEGGMFYFLNGTYWDGDHFTEWDNKKFAYCPVCGEKIKG